MFQLETKMVRITSIEVRKEKDEKGDQHSVCDIGITAPMENEVLDHFHPLYRSSFYTGDDQADMVSGTRLPHLKFPFPRFPHKGSLEGYVFLAHIGAGGPSEVKLNDSVINSVKFLLQDKGAVTMSFVVRARTHRDDVGKLSELLDTEVQISLVPPNEQKQFALEQAKKNRKRALEDHFTPEPGREPAEGGADDDRTGDLPLDDPEDGGNQDTDFREVDPPEASGQGQYQVE
ncbi:hypothetical protein [Herbaspirillum huttiense]|uniref:hypothetical protein n=1 Tax=Herbaspirillum huttiense TaxID=863372 RepID=UPI0031D23658